MHKARFETICDSPLIIYDGCHNENAVSNFIDMVNMYYKNTTRTFVVSILKTKDYNTILKQLSTFEYSTFIFTSGNDNERYLSKETLLETYSKYGSTTNLLAMELPNAIDYILNNSLTDVNFVIGSFYIYSDVLNIIEKNKHLDATKSNFL